MPRSLSRIESDGKDPVWIKVGGRVISMNFRTYER